MRINYQQMRRKPWLLKSFFRISVTEFDALYAKVLPEWSAREQAWLSAR